MILFLLSLLTRVHWWVDSFQFRVDGWSRRLEDWYYRTPPREDLMEKIKAHYRKHTEGTSR